MALWKLLRRGVPPSALPLRNEQRYRNLYAAKQRSSFHDVSCHRCGIGAGDGASGHRLWPSLLPTRLDQFGLALLPAPALLWGCGHAESRRAESRGAEFQPAALQRLPQVRGCFSIALGVLDILDNHGPQSVSLPIRAGGMVCREAEGIRSLRGGMI